MDDSVRLTILEEKHEELLSRFEQLENIVRYHTVLVDDNESQEQAVEKWLSALHDEKAVFIPKG
jgi:exopolyphosphatase/pppGpp-phosphohydrolase